MQKTKIELLGIKYYLGLGFLDRMVEGTGKQLSELGAVPEVHLYPILVYYSRAYACERLGLAIDFTKEDIFDYIDEQGGMFGQFIKDFAGAYIRAMSEDVPQDDNSKKKVIKAKK